MAALWHVAIAVLLASGPAPAGAARPCSPSALVRAENDAARDLGWRELERVEPVFAWGGGASLEQVEDEGAAQDAIRACGLIHRVGPAVPPVRPKAPPKPSVPAAGESI